MRIKINKPLLDPNFLSLLLWYKTRLSCQMVRSAQPTGVLIPVVYLFGGEESKAKNSKVAHKYAEHREHGEFTLLRASGE
jgi:hypothetical protein